MTNNTATTTNANQTSCDLFEQFGDILSGLNLVKTQVSTLQLQIKNAEKLIAYIKEHKLENKTNSQIISPDDNLKHLLGLEQDNELTYFNIQKYMNKHFVKTSTI